MPHSIIVYENGGPEVMNWTEISLQNPGKGEVRIDQKKVGLNFIDVYQRSGHGRFCSHTGTKQKRIIARVY